MVGRTAPEGIVIPRAAWTRQPWKNGGGVTHEIFRFRDPAWHGEREAHEFDLRLSVAELDGAQPFSLFPGYARVLVPLEATSLELVIGGSIAPMTKHHTIRFPGDVAVATQGTGRALDLNVISRVVERAGAHVEVSTSESTRHSPRIWPTERARNLAVFALTNVVLRGSARTAERELEAFDTLVHVDHAGDVAYTASEPVVWVRF